MSIDDLGLELSKFGTVQILKDGYVFSLVITGSDLSQSKPVLEIQRLVLEYCKNRFPFIEALRNDKEFFCLILKPDAENGY